MTRNRDFKTLVRDRMAKTGERYSTARSHVLASRPVPVASIGGQQPDLAAARNLCTNVGVVGPDGTPMTEAMAFGLAGGVGFLYGVFEYGDTPTMTIVARNQSMPDPFCRQLFESLHLAVNISTTSGAKKAAKSLDAAIDSGQPALCTVGAGGLPYLGLPEEEASMSPHLVGVIGTTATGDLLIDDRSPNPIVVERTTFDAARALYKQAKHRMVTVPTSEAERVSSIDWALTVTQAVDRSVEGFNTPPVPQFKSNIGLAGLAKWQNLLMSSTKKSWSTIFGHDRRAAIGLSRLYDCINYAYTAPDAGRPLFAQFLIEAAGIANRPDWADAGELWNESGAAWRTLSETVLSAHPDIERYGQLSDQRVSAIDDGGATGTADEISDLVSLSAEQDTMVKNLQFSPERATAVFGQLAEIVGSIVEVETEALHQLGSD